ncbi:tetratricopeptide repeat protein [Blattabacterium cuenoti]|uniref:TPR domain-containing protein n=1 Tax=Blattabacterium cuenoti STAT TaxID=1457030 RepID=A0A224AI17_9FLAO|nr:tetratricopeptide repeat protein [Blattabacterium cuenoti]BBA17033.1 TPR domain-containing protein [Blattabacterium cuenoti STAT]
MKKKLIFFSITLIIISYISYFFFKKLFLYPSEEKSMKELSYAQQYLSQGEIDKALNKKNIKVNLGFSGIASKYPFTKAGNISKFYAGICYYKLGDYKKSIKIMNSFSAKDEFLSSIKYGIIGDAFSQMKKKKEALKNYVIAANVTENEITTPLYYYKAALLNFYMKKYSNSKFFLKKIEKKYPSFLYKKNVEKYITFIENKL